MKMLLARCVVVAMFLAPTMTSAFDPPFDVCTGLTQPALWNCLKPILDAMDRTPIRNAAGQTRFEEVMGASPARERTAREILEKNLQPAIPANATDLPSDIETELENTLKGIITSCKSSEKADTCILTKIERKRSRYEAFLDRTAPAAWPDVDITSFIFFHVSRQIAQEQIHCNSLEASAKQSCLEQIPTLVSDARDEARHILIDKGAAYGNRQAAERNTQDRQRQQEYAEAQREQELERARIQALGMFLGSGGFKFSQPAPYQPPPPVVMPMTPAYQSPLPRPPVNCTSNRVGDYTYTNCY